MASRSVTVTDLAVLITPLAIYEYTTHNSRVDHRKLRRSDRRAFFLRIGPYTARSVDVILPFYYGKLSELYSRFFGSMFVWFVKPVVLN